jgi:coenzyme F420-reducing hydrogenase alpha subunit
MAKDHPMPFRRGLRIKKTGNAIMDLVGGRAVHPVNVRVGGFYRAPTRAELRGLLPEIEWSLGSIRETLEWVSGFSFPELDRDYELVALRHASEYPFCEGRVVSTKGLDVSVREYGDQIIEEQVPYSTALHAQLRGRGAYLCGPLARINLNFDRLGDAARDAARSVGFEVPCRNPFRSILARTIEILQALDEARRIIESYVAPDPPFVDIPQRRGTGHGATEAPRGLLYHCYGVDEEGTVLDARIVPPTSQNQGSIEGDLFAMAGVLAELPHGEATRRAEHAIRNHDPCISCATHFLTLRIERQ